MRTAGKWMVGISIFLLIGTYSFFFLTCVAGIVVSILFWGMIAPDVLPETIPIQFSVPIGSPAFYMLVAESALLLLGIIFWIFGKKKQKTVESL